MCSEMDEAPNKNRIKHKEQVIREGSVLWLTEEIAPTTSIWANNFLSRRLHEQSCNACLNCDLRDSWKLQSRLMGNYGSPGLELRSQSCLSCGNSLTLRQKTCVVILESIGWLK